MQVYKDDREWDDATQHDTKWYISTQLPFDVPFSLLNAVFLIPSLLRDEAGHLRCPDWVLYPVFIVAEISAHKCQWHNDQEPQDKDHGIALEGNTKR